MGMILDTSYFKKAVWDLKLKMHEQLLSVLATSV
jgi:hypothetical protein